MALSLDTTISGSASIIVEDGTGSAVSSITTAAFSTAANVRLVAIVSSNSENTPFTHTVSGAGLGWTKEVANGETGGSAIVSIWVAYSASALSSQTVMATLNGGGGAPVGASMSVLGILGAETTHGGAEATSSSASGTPSCAVTSTRAGSYIVSGMSDWAAAGDTAVTGAAPAQTLLNTHHSATWYSAGQGRSTNTVSIGSQTMGFTVGGRDYKMAVLEIRESAAPVIPNFDYTLFPKEKLRIPRGKVVT